MRAWVRRMWHRLTGRCEYCSHRLMVMEPGIFALYCLVCDGPQ